MENSRDGYNLKEGMILKFGKSKFLVKEISAKSKDLNDDKKEIVINSQNKDEKKQPDAKGNPNLLVNEDINNINVPIATEEINLHVSPRERYLIKEFQETNKEKLAENLICRICQSDENTKENPLISPCKCTGSIKYIHINCIQEWYKNKMIVKSHLNATSYIIKNLECELCKQPFSTTFKYDTKNYDFVPIIRPKSNAYIILETLIANETYIHVIRVDDKQDIKIGRGQECDIRILNDNTGSRYHAFIKFDKDEFLLFDNNSKFGTTVLMQEEAIVSADHPICLQIGRTVLNFSFSTSKTTTCK